MKRILSGAAVLAIVGGALAFTTAGQTKNIYCFATADLPSIVTTESCTTVGQPAAQLVDFVVNPNGAAIDPCAAFPNQDNPYQGTASACTSAAGDKFSAPGL